MLIDTHCHLDAPEFDTDRAVLIQQSLQAGVDRIVIPAVARFNFETVRNVAHAWPGGAYALGIHPLYVHRSEDADLMVLRQAIMQSMDDPRFVAIGEIGLDFFVADIAVGAARARQEHFLKAQLKMAAEFGLPVLLHVRRSQDSVLKYLRQTTGLCGGIAHAFNGSEQQARAFIEQGCALGIGGAMTFERALRIRRHAAQIDLAHLVLETDAPDIPPAWLGRDQAGAVAAGLQRNAPAELAGIAQALAVLRQVSVETIRGATTAAACRVLPRLVGIA